MPHYDYMPDGGCGDSRCNNGWYYWNGSEYPCSPCEKIRKQKREEREADKRAAERGDG